MAESSANDESGIYVEPSAWYTDSDLAWSLVNGPGRRCQSFDLYNFSNCGITMA